MSTETQAQGANPPDLSGAFADPSIARWDRSFFGHPLGLSTLFFTEMWERFSYYGMRALLILFMVATTAKGGLGFPTSKAGAIYGEIVKRGGFPQGLFTGSDAQLENLRRNFESWRADPFESSAKRD